MHRRGVDDSACIKYNVPTHFNTYTDLLVDGRIDVDGLIGGNM